jgi:cyclin-dependent kinase 7
MYVPVTLTSQLLDVFSVKQNVNLVLEFLDTDLEAVIRDKSLVFQTADIKSWLAMSLRGLEYIHRNGVLHRVCRTPCVLDRC